VVKRTKKRKLILGADWGTVTLKLTVTEQKELNNGETITFIYDEIGLDVELKEKVMLN